MIENKSLILKSDFDKIKKFIKDCSQFIYIDFLKKEILKGYRDFYIGQKIKPIFDDNGFGRYELSCIIIDILIEKEDNFCLLLVPEDNLNFFPSMNKILLEYGIKNLDVPKDGCFLARHISRNNFILENEEKTISSKELFNVNIFVPKLFVIPEETKNKIFVYKKLNNDKILNCMQRIIMEKN